MSYESWRISYQSSEQAARAAYAEIEKLRNEVERLKSMTAVTMGVGQGDGKLFVHGDYESIKAAQDIVLERDKLRKEVEEWRSFAEAQVELRDEAEDHAEDLAKSLAELITWIPSADTYRRLGFDPEAPMRALKRAKLSLGGVSSA